MERYSVWTRTSPSFNAGIGVDSSLNVLSVTDPRPGRSARNRRWLVVGAIMRVLSERCRDAEGDGDESSETVGYMYAAHKSDGE